MIKKKYLNHLTAFIKVLIIIIKYKITIILKKLYNRNRNYKNKKK